MQFVELGQIPKYSILDFSASYTLKKIKLETGVNNMRFSINRLNYSKC